MLCALIMAGGKGTRFWPLSTEQKPKQFLNLIGDNTMIQMTINRVKPIIPLERIFICTSEKYINLVKEQVPEIPEKNIIVEPVGRNTMPCIALSAFVIKRYYKDANMLILPSDHLINEEEKFRNIVLAADNFIEKNKDSIVTLGMSPTRAETNYGYIKYGQNIHYVNETRLIEVESFKEKPSKELAKKYFEDKSYLWNGGMFVWRISNILMQISRYSNKSYEILKILDSTKEEDLQFVIDSIYEKTEAISIDYAVLEKAKDIYVIPCDFGWDDVGSWRAVERYREKDRNDNILTENVRVIESTSNMAINKGKKMVMIGIKDIMTVETDDAIFIVNKDYMDNLRDYKNII